MAAVKMLESERSLETKISLLSCNRGSGDDLLAPEACAALAIVLSAGSPSNEILVGDRTVGCATSVRHGSVG